MGMDASGSLIFLGASFCFFGVFFFVFLGVLRREGAAAEAHVEEEQALNYARIQRVHAHGGLVGPRIFGGGRPAFVRPPHRQATSVKVASSLSPINTSILLGGEH